MKKTILYTLIVTFCLSALLGIGIIVLDMWNDLTSRVLLTTVTIFGFSIPALCCSAIYGKEDKKILSIIGIAVCVLSGLHILLMIWEIIPDDLLFDDSNLNLLFSGIILSVSLGHLSLMNLIDNKDSVVNSVKMSTIGVSVILDCLLMMLIWVKDFDEVVAWQIYAIIAILIVLGTIVCPILNKARANVIQVENNNSNDEIIKARKNLKELLDSGYVTQEEFDRINDRINKKNN